MAHQILQGELAFVDIETSGSFTHHDKIIEIGVLKTQNGKLIKTFETLINPEVPISYDSTRITGITNEMVKDAPTFAEVKDTLFSLLHGTTFIAHNVSFDFDFVESSFHQLQMPFSAGQLCTVRLSRFLYPTYQRHNLDSIISRFDLSIDRRHRAFDDAKIVSDFFKIVTDTFDDYTLSLAFDAIYKPPKVLKPLQDASQMSLL